VSLATSDGLCPKSIRLILHPTFGSRGERLHGKFIASRDGRQLCVSRQPLLDAPRGLLAEGVDPKMPIVTRHAGADFDAMVSTVGEAAKWTVRENETTSPAFAGHRGQPPMRQNGRPVPDPTSSAHSKLPDGPK
jgi:hypothetical protein